MGGGCVVREWGSGGGSVYGCSRSVKCGVVAWGCV